MEGRPYIYLVNIDVSYKKGKKKLTTHNSNLDVVSLYNTTTDIQKDSITMSRIQRNLYASTYNGEQIVMVRKVNWFKPVGRSMQFYQKSKKNV